MVCKYIFPFRSFLSLMIHSVRNANVWLKMLQPINPKSLPNLSFRPYHCTGIPMSIQYMEREISMRNWITSGRTVWMRTSIIGTRTLIDCSLLPIVETGMKMITGIGRGIVQMTENGNETVIGIVTVIEIDTGGVMAREIGQRIAENIITKRLIENARGVETEITGTDIVTKRIVMTNTVKIPTKKTEITIEWINRMAIPMVNPNSDPGVTNNPRMVILQSPPIHIHPIKTIHQLHLFPLLLLPSIPSGIRSHGKPHPPLLPNHLHHLCPATTMASRTGTMMQTILLHLHRRHLPLIHQPNPGNTKTERKSKKTIKPPSIWTLESP